jgi:hypothetical protein
MRILSHKAVRIVGLTTLVSLPRAAAADPVVVTGGNVEVMVPAGLTRGFFEGQDFFMRFHTDGFVNSLDRQCRPCAPGDMVDFGGTYNLPITGATAEVDGVTYTQIFPDMTGTFVTSSIRVEGSETMTLSVPFTYSGTVIGFLENPLTREGDAPSLFTRSLVGSGTATARFIFLDQEDQDPSFTADDLRYQFDDAEPIPEPATMTLFAAGAAALAARRRRGVAGKSR